ncbi:MAG: hypothetical protein ACRD24_11470 [Terriglobales bacterium]
MQAAKDSFFRALQTRLGTVNPARTVVVDGVTRPAILVVENEAYPPPKLYFHTFYIHWLGAAGVRGFSRTLAPRYEQIAQIEYFIQGTPSLQRPFADRGRLTGQLDQELMLILFPGFAEKLDHSAVPPQTLGSYLQWRWTPDLRTLVEGDGSVLRRLTTVMVSFYLEAFPN